MSTIVTVRVALAQSRPSFEVATIKVNKSGSRQVNFNPEMAVSADGRPGRPSILTDRHSLLQRGNNSD
jgi:hypothetical protein